MDFELLIYYQKMAYNQWLDLFILILVQELIVFLY